MTRQRDTNPLRSLQWSRAFIGPRSSSSMYIVYGLRCRGNVLLRPGRHPVLAVQCLRPRRASTPPADQLLRASTHQPTTVVNQPAGIPHFARGVPYLAGHSKTRANLRSHQKHLNQCARTRSHSRQLTQQRGRLEGPPPRRSKEPSITPVAAIWDHVPATSDAETRTRIS